MRWADRGRFRDRRVRDPRALDFHGAQAMAADVNHVVYAPHQPEISVLIAAGAVAGGVTAFDVAPVLLHEPFWIAIDRPQHRWPGACDDQISALVRPDGDAVSGLNVRNDAREGKRSRSGLGRDRPRNGSDHDRAGLGLPPCIDYGAAPLA